MPGTRIHPGSDAKLTATLPGFPEQEFTLAGAVNYRAPTPTRDIIEDTQGTESQFRWKFGKGVVSLTVTTDRDLSILRNMESGQLRLSFGNGRLITLAGVTQYGDAIQEDATAGTTGEITFAFNAGTDTNAT